MSEHQVARICDRRAGIGADGVIRVVRCEAYDDPAAVEARSRAEWFMDYRNADGSLSQMCGNGIRVLGRYLAQVVGVDVTAPVPIGTRSGVRLLEFHESDDPDGEGSRGDISVDMGAPRVLGDTKVGVGTRSWSALHVSMGNPHAVAFVDSLADPGPLIDAPDHDPVDFPEGVNVEFVVRRGPRHVAMRVHERGSGETRSCGTGACAAMVASALADGHDLGAHDAASGETSYVVDVPGGRLRVTWTPTGRVLLAGPAVLVAQGEWLDVL